MNLNFKQLPGYIKFSDTLDELYIPKDHEFVFESFQYKDYKQALKVLGIGSGMRVIAFFDTYSMGNIRNKNFSRDQFADFFLAGLSEIVGTTGTVFIPTFTYNFCYSENYNPYSSMPRNGLIPQRACKLKNIYRTLHPIYSFAIMGKPILEINPSSLLTCFGPDSVFDSLLSSDFYFCFIGRLGVNMCTPAHVLEETVGVSYRFKKKFFGSISLDGNDYPLDCEFFARDLELDPQPDFSALEQDLRQTNLIHEASLGNTKIQVCNGLDIRNVGMKGILANNNYFIKGRN